MLTAADLTKLLDLARAATPGPWRTESTSLGGYGFLYSASVEGADPYEKHDGSYRGYLIAESIQAPHNLGYIEALSPEVITALIPIVQAAIDCAKAQLGYGARACDVAQQRLHAATVAAFPDLAIIDAEFDEVDPVPTGPPKPIALLTDQPPRCRSARDGECQ